MASITLNRGNTLPDSSAKADFHNLVDQATASITNIVNADVSNSAAIGSSKIDLSAVGQKIIMSSKAVDFAQGSDVASATTTDIGAATGNFVDVTGTTTITGLGTIQAGSVRFVRFTGILTLTHDGTSLILPTGANVTTAAGDRAIFVSLGSGNWICLAYQRADGTPLGSAYTPTVANALSGSVIQVVNTQTGAVATGTTVMVDDDSIPQKTEGDQYMTLAITPNHASNKLRIDINGHFFSTASGSPIFIMSLFQDDIADALSSNYDAMPSGLQKSFSFTHYMAAGTTSETTFKVRAGAAAAGTTTFNGVSGGRKLGGAIASSITITEIKA